MPGQGCREAFIHLSRVPRLLFIPDPAGDGPGKRAGGSQPKGVPAGTMQPRLAGILELRRVAIQEPTRRLGVPAGITEPRVVDILQPTRRPGVPAGITEPRVVDIQMPSLAGIREAHLADTPEGLRRAAGVTPRADIRKPTLPAVPIRRRTNTNRGLSSGGQQPRGVSA